MKSGIKKLFLLPALIAGLGLLLTGRVTAQTFTTLHSFSAFHYDASTGGNTNSDGVNPESRLILSGNVLYGTAFHGGESGKGTVFAINKNGTSFTNLHSFTGSDGAYPQAGVLLSANTLFGTARNVGTSGYGMVFAVSTNGTGFTNLFAGSDGGEVGAGLVLSSNTLYGAAVNGGNWGNGMVFTVNIDGTAFTNLYSFTALNNSTNSDGTTPNGLILSGNTLYGTANRGGSHNFGTVFAVSTDGLNFTNLHSFTGGDGQYPAASLILSGNTLYGVARFGGDWGNGTVFAVNTDGSGFTNMHSFARVNYNSSGVLTNSDGFYPSADLSLSGNTLYGTAAAGGSAGCGTVFAINTNGMGFTTLYNFTATSTDSIGAYTNSDGQSPVGGLILSGNTLFGAAGLGGSWGNGTIFSLSFAPQLTIILSGSNVILTWPTNVAGFDYTGYTLQSTTNLAPPAVLTTVFPGPVVLNGQNTVTNPLSGAKMFYRLVQPAIPTGMALIPAGFFTMGDTLDGEADATPVSVMVSAFYMDTNLVSYSLWTNVYAYATSHGYGFDHAGSARTLNQSVQPVQTVDWYDCVKWSNARSQQAGLAPVYYTDAGFTQVYTNGNTDTVYANWAANGYRLPTEAEWEKAARGGLSGKRFPWGDTISESQANYYAYPSQYTYDLGPYIGYNTNFYSGAPPYIGTSPVGYFAPNGYGLYDMAGNVYEWCWDWYAGPTYPAGSPYLGGTDPRGPVGPLSYRVPRGGQWVNNAFAARCAYRFHTLPNFAGNAFGFRCVMGL